MRDYTGDPAQPAAWADAHLPDEAEDRADKLGERPGQDAAGGPPGAAQGAQFSTPADQDREPHTDRDSSSRQDTNAYAFGATTRQPTIGPGYSTLPLGPGNEAMEGGESPVPRGYTGGAMGKVNAGLSPGFANAAIGDPLPWEAPLHSAREAAKRSTLTAGAQPPSAGNSPQAAPAPAADAMDVTEPDKP